MPNAEIELHDSEIVGIRADGSGVVLDLDAYVHVSEGVPGVDAGTAWSEPFKVTVRDAAVQNELDGETLWIIDGTVRLDGRVLENMLPVALDYSGVVEMRLVGSEGALTVTGAGLRIESTGERTYVQEFHPAKG